MDINPMASESNRSSSMPFKDHFSTNMQRILTGNQDNPECQETYDENAAPNEDELIHPDDQP